MGDLVTEKIILFGLRPTLDYCRGRVPIPSASIAAVQTRFNIRTGRSVSSSMTSLTKPLS